NNLVDIFVFNMDNGFVLVAGDDASKPVLGYSFDQNFVYSDEKPNIKYWIDLYRTNMQDIRDNQLGNEITLIKWENILDENFSVDLKNTKAVAPLMSTTWNQSPIYNDYCPLDGGSLSVVGCVATAMSQIMKYHSYPLHGDGQHSYNELGQTLSVDYFFSTYNWNDMPNSISSGSTPSQKHEVAQISYHAGVAVEMMYGADGSGAYSTDVPYALKTYFKYNAGVAHYSRSAFNTTQWKNMIIENLDRALPIYYSGQSDAGGHAFVCDGYQDTEYYHFNWGWGGSSDGYFTLDDVNGFSDYQAIVKDIQPDSVDLTVDPFIEDYESNEAEIIINLNDYFTSASGSSIDYFIDPASDINGLTHSITDGILTLTKVGNGLSKVVVEASNRSDATFDIFYVRFGDPLPLAGLGNTYNLNAFSTINAGNNAALNSMEKLSVSMWVKLNQIGINQGIISKASSTASGWYVQLQTNNIIKFFIKTQDGFLRKIYSATALEADKWYHLAFVFDGKDFVLYINGEFDSQKTSYTSTSIIQHDEANDLVIGFAPGMYFDGSIDDVCIWDQPKSLDFFRTILETHPNVSDEDLVSYWNLDEGFNDDISDLNSINNAFIEGLNLEYWSNSTAPVKYFIERNTNASGALPGDKDATLSYSVVTNGTLGTMSILDAVAGTFEYTPDTDIFGVDTLTYKVDDGTYSSEIISLIIDIKDGNSIDNVSIPISAILHQNYPNPFNPETTISFTILEEGPAKLVVFDRMGRNIKTLSDGFSEQGNHSIMWDGKNSFGESVASGVYYYMLKTNNFTDVKKALLIK
ncbi:MAG: T9SS type A sorting domain-containing protein, partial [Candidatus Delongbacteria bacterium]|nr:T9SS type A sorting domain-containing protein [Candidatus Delongbacteria bacterium]